MASPLSFVRQLLGRLDEYWFGIGSPVALGVFRIVYGVLATTGVLMLLPFWREWYGSDGYVPPATGSSWLGGRLPIDFGPYETGLSVPRLSLIGGITDPTLVIGFMVLVVIAGVFLSVGYKTRIAGWVFALGIVSLHHRNIGILNGGDTVIRVLALIMAVAPCGNACSIDRLVSIWKGSEGVQPRAVSVWGQRVVSYEVALIYFTTVWCKWFGETWIHGTATWYPPRLAEMKRFPTPGFLHEFPLVTVTTYGTLIVEFLLATLVFYRPWRKWILIAGVGMHLYIDFSMNIPLFSQIMVSMYLCFFDGEELTTWAKKVGRRFPQFRVEVVVPEGASLRLPSLIHAADPFGWIHLEQSEVDQWSATDATGKVIPWWTAVATRAAGLWVFMPVFPLLRRWLQRASALPG